MMDTNHTPRVLVVDDSPDVHLLLRVGLKTERVDLVTALTPAEGLELALGTSPDLVLLDVDMPGQDGFDVCRLLKEHAVTRDVPVIFLTGEADVGTKVRGFDLGAVDYIVKPWNVHELRARVRAALRTRALHLLLAARARTDGLTGLWNRAYFDDRLSEEVARVERSGGSLALGLVDLDFFKLVNDTFGHPAGDRVLQDVAYTLARAVRSSDVVCRFGGEEFVVILPDTDLAGAEEAGARLCDAIRLLKRPDGAAVTASIGVAAFAPSLRPHELVGAADEALYAAKSQGRDRVAVAA